MIICGTRAKNDAETMTPVLKENCPDAIGRCGLFICMKTCNID